MNLFEKFPIFLLLLIVANLTCSSAYSSPNPYDDLRRYQRMKNIWELMQTRPNLYLHAGEINRIEKQLDKEESAHGGHVAGKNRNNFDTLDAHYPMLEQHLGHKHHPMYHKDPQRMKHMVDVNQALISLIRHKSHLDPKKERGLMRPPIRNEHLNSDGDFNYQQRLNKNSVKDQSQYTKPRSHSEGKEDRPKSSTWSSDDFQLKEQKAARKAVQQSDRSKRMINTGDEQINKADYIKQLFESFPREDREISYVPELLILDHPRVKRIRIQNLKKNHQTKCKRVKKL